MCYILIDRLNDGSLCHWWPRPVLDLFEWCLFRINCIKWTAIPKIRSVISTNNQMPLYIIQTHTNANRGEISNNKKNVTMLLLKFTSFECAHTLWLWPTEVQDCKFWYFHSTKLSLVRAIQIINVTSTFVCYLYFFSLLYNTFCEWLCGHE